MLSFKAIPKIVLTALVLGIVVSVGVVLAQTGGPENAEAGHERRVNSSTSGSNEEVVGAEADVSFGDFLTNGEGQPDTAAPHFTGEEEELQVGSRAPAAQFFKRSAGSNFQPRDSVATFSYGGGGCIKRDSNVGDSWFTIDLQLPDGAEIDFLRVYYYDNNATYDINSELWAFDGAGGTTLIAEADSTGTPGYSSEGSGFFSHIVDNINESLVVVVSIQGGVGATVELCGIRIRYQYTLSGSYLPAILNQATP